MARAQLEDKAQPAAALPAQNKEPGVRDRRSAMARDWPCRLPVLPCLHRALPPSGRLISRCLALPPPGRLISRGLAFPSHGRLISRAFPCSVLRALLEGNCASAARRKWHERCSKARSNRQLPEAQKSKPSARNATGGEMRKTYAQNAQRLSYSLFSV